MHKKKGLLILLSVLVCHLAMAQNDERYEEYSKEDDIAPGVSAQILKLKKSYKLGDGITLRSSAGSFNVSQSLQTSFLVNTANKDLTSMSSTFNLTRARLSISSIIGLASFLIDALTFFKSFANVDRLSFARSAILAF